MEEYYSQERDDETVIVWNDDSDRNLWKFSQTQTSQDNATQQKEYMNTEHQSSLDNHDREAPPSLISRNRQRRSLGRNFRRSRNKPTDQQYQANNKENVIRDKSPSREPVDDFASLLSNIDRSSSARDTLSNQQPLDGERETKIPREAEIEKGETTMELTVSSPANSPQTEYLESVNNTSRIHESPNGKAASGGRQLLCSPPDFEFCAFEDNDNDDDDLNEQTLNTTQTTSMPSRRHVRHRDKHKRQSCHEDDNDFENDCNSWRTNRSKTKQTDRSKTSSTRKSIQHDVPKRISAVSDSTKRRKRSHPETASRRVFSSSLNSKNDRPLHSSQPTQSTTNVENANNSIVGLRPTHWNRSTRVQNRNSSSKERKKSLQQLAKTSSLTAATRFSFHKKSNRASHSSRSDCTSPIQDSGHTTTEKNTRSSRLSPMRTNHTIDSRKRPSSDAPKSSFSFAPAFVTTKSSALSQDSIGDDSGDDCRVVTAPMNRSLSSTPPRRRRKMNGEWVKRFISLQNVHSNDSVRLQNKAFARQKMLFDVSDPRKRAKTCTDVTILGEYIGPWINVPDDTKISVLGYVHRHKKRNQSHIDKHRYIVKQQQLQNEDDTEIISNDFFAWFTFTLATARRIELEQGCRLKIYNAIILPCRLPVTLEAPPRSIFSPHNNIQMDETVRCENTVICTQLCERIASFNSR